jgi:hypothetical protein
MITAIVIALSLLFKIIRDRISSKHKFVLQLPN